MNTMEGMASSKPEPKLPEDTQAAWQLHSLEPNSLQAHLLREPWNHQGSFAAAHSQAHR